MRRSISESSACWTVVKPRPQALVRLFCCPYAGGNATLFRPWALELPETIEVRALQPPGRATRMAEKPFTNLAAFVEAIGPHTVELIDRPFVLFGHSLGAIVAFELARWLRRHHRSRPEHLFVSGRRAPEIPESDPPKYTKSDEDLVASLHEMNGTPPEVLAHEELLGLMLPMVRADFQMIETYEYVEERPLGCPITVLSGEADPEDGPAHVAAWRSHTSSRFTQHTLAGDHFFINTNHAEVLRLVRTELARTLDASQLARASAPRTSP